MPAVYAALGLNGEKRWTVGEPVVVIVNAFDELSIKRLLCKVNKLVPDIAVSGVVLGVKLLV